MKVSIITEGLENIGHGHITRCLSLYEAFAERNIYPTIYVNGDKHAQLLLTNCRYKTIDWLTHPAKLIAYINNSDIIIVDSYLAGKEYYNNFIKLSRHSLFVDDNLRLDYPEGNILNGTINSENFPYKKTNNNFLLGAKYIPVRKEFWNIPQRKFNKNIQSILITFGGQDIRNLTPDILKNMIDLYPDVIKNVVVGSGFKCVDKIKKLDNRNVVFHYSPDAVKMKELMISSDVAITAAGQTLYELAVTGTPTIAVAVVENQLNNIREWKKKGFLLDAIQHNDRFYLRKINEHLSKMINISTRKKLSIIGRDNVDGQGPRRVVSYLIDKTCHESGFYFRKAVETDSDQVYKLSNDPSVRQNSINTRPIELEDHQNWFADKILDDNYVFYLVFDKKDNFIGQIRFELSIDSAVTSISISGEFRGKGLSKKIIQTGCSKIFSEHHQIKKIIAYIRPENHVSINSFTSSGFVLESDELINGHIFLKYFLNRT
ncbi:MAG: bifunctional UDP-2,4-diacetamido-2,4,6-trideoxy-beta-L-altropyranose hydrolase/GNAT family N-acetyltransferase [Bacteroidota bacterium]